MNHERSHVFRRLFESKPIRHRNWACHSPVAVVPFRWWCKQNRLTTILANPQKDRNVGHSWKYQVNMSTVYIYIYELNISINIYIYVYIILKTIMFYLFAGHYSSIQRITGWHMASPNQDAWMDHNSWSCCFHPFQPMLVAMLVAGRLVATRTLWSTRDGLQFLERLL